MNTLAQLGCAVGEAAAMCAKGGYSPRELYTKGHARELQERLGGAFPGHPDPAYKDWLIVDDEDRNVRFEGGWEFGWNCNGGQQGDRSHFAKAPDCKAVYPLQVPEKGRYALKGLVPHLFNQPTVPIAKLTVRSGTAVKEIEWNQLPNSGFWQDLAELDLEPGATLEVSAGKVDPSAYGNRWHSAFFADGFAIVK